MTSEKRRQKTGVPVVPKTLILIWLIA